MSSHRRCLYNCLPRRAITRRQRLFKDTFLTFVLLKFYAYLHRKAAEPPNFALVSYVVLLPDELARHARISMVLALPLLIRSLRE